MQSLSSAVGVLKASRGQPKPALVRTMTMTAETDDEDDDDEVMTMVTMVTMVTMMTMVR